MEAANFFVVGAAKAATTALYHALREHDAVFLPAVKEPHVYAYLADPAKAAHLYPDRATARRRYRELYAGVTSETAVGDASTTNLVVDGAAAAIAQDVPAARIVAVLRHPVDRAFAHWAHFLAAGGEPISDFAEAIRQERPRLRAGLPFTYQYLGWGHYSTQLPPFLERFGSERVLVHLYDDLCADAAGVVRRTLGFLGVDDSRAIPRVERHNEMPVARFPAIHGALAGRGRAGRAVSGVLPARARHAASGWAAEHLTWQPTLDLDLRAQLTAGLEEEISRLEELIDRDLSGWR